VGSVRVGTVSGLVNHLLRQGLLKLIRASTVSQAQPAFMAAANRVNLPTKPASGGMPVSEQRYDHREREQRLRAD